MFRSKCLGLISEGLISKERHVVKAIFHVVWISHIVSVNHSSGSFIQSDRSCSKFGLPSRPATQSESIITSSDSATPSESHTRRELAEAKCYTEALNEHIDFAGAS